MSTKRRGIQELLSANYVPFGSQYYRAPSPHQADWENDLVRMSDLGFNMVKFWVQWRWNNPGEDKYYFDDIDRLMDLSDQYHLKVMLNTIFDVAPAWIYKKYPDASMVTLNGRKIGPQTQPHRQIGGLGFCLNHPGVEKHFFQFLEETVKRYSDHPALEIWNVGSEPELTSSMAEMRLYADNADKMGDMLCFCDHCRQKFPQWLAKRYTSIDELNLRWNRNFTSFDEVEVPVTRNTFNDMIDWRMFFVDTLGNNVRKRFEVAQKIDKGRHALMCHHVFVQGFPVTSTANDPWNVGQYGDLHGFTQMDDAMMIDVLRSCAKDKPVISAEMLMLPGYTLDLPQQISADDIKRFIFSGLAGNQKGFIFWQYRPEILGREAPTWGLTHLNGSETPRLNWYADCGHVLQNNKKLILNGKPRKAELALIYNPENQIFAWMATKNEKSATDSLLGAHRALYEYNYVIDLIHPMEFDRGILANYKCIYFPFPYVLNEKMSDDLKEWVHNGGVLIGESYFGGWNIENGHHEKNIPGYGWHDIFKTYQFDVTMVSEDNDEVIIIDKELRYLPRNSQARPMMIREQLVTSGSQVLACFSDGSPAVTMSEYGKGRAILIGSYIGLGYHRHKLEENGALIASLAEVAKIERPQIKDDRKVRIDLIDSDYGVIMIMQNLEKSEVDAEIRIRLKKDMKFTEQFDNEILQVKSDGQYGQANRKLKPSEVRVYVARK